MTTYKKPFAGKPVLPPRPAPGPADTKRTFDARPKVSDDRRREERARPGQHVDPLPADPLDGEAGAKDEAAED
jgi:hypothetical protein